jgi:hypothetical protein
MHFHSFSGKPIFYHIPFFPIFLPVFFFFVNCRGKKLKILQIEKYKICYLFIYLYFIINQMWQMYDLNDEWMLFMWVFFFGGFWKLGHVFGTELFFSDLLVIYLGIFLRGLVYCEEQDPEFLILTKFNSIFGLLDKRRKFWNWNAE